MSAREQILSRLGPSLPVSGGVETAAVAPPRAEGLVELFADRALHAKCSVDMIGSMAGVPGAVSRWLSAEKLERRLIAEPMDELSAADWLAEGLVSAHKEISPDNDIFVGVAYAALAEFGAIVVSSHGNGPLVNAFLAETHIVILPVQRLVADLEAYWALLRNEFVNNSVMPREFCFVNGPSRTGDLGLPVKLGAHGPARVHVVVVGA